MLFLIIRALQKAYFVVAIIIAIALVTSPISVHAGEGAGVLSIRNSDAPGISDPDPFSVLPSKGKFLVATRNLMDPRFQETVILLIDYNDKGAMGLIINRPTSVPLIKLLPSVPGLKKQTIVYYGGPVEGYRMLMLIQSNEKPAESVSVFSNVYVSSSKNTLEHLVGEKNKERHFRIYAGYAGWTTKQLDWEVSRGDWLVVHADAESVFRKKSTNIWHELFLRGSAIQVWNQDGRCYPLTLQERPSFIE